MGCLEQLTKKSSLTSSWPKELKLQEIEASNGFKDNEDNFVDDDDDDDDDDYFDYEDDDEYDDEEEEEYDDDYYDEDFFKGEEEGTTTTTTTTTMKPTADPYFTHYDPREEHDAYKKA